ncbi:hypothetical protein GN244_ATG06132 [Phytophthora infestans]|uniref:Uncharacterized protein n=1 Tax=Phytophthora infestans TaxID=4787 RepID=A0A833T378_PHYIN|nr:hypothetical protein GN244_ATG06132 [Phytophthora infestans]
MVTLSTTQSEYMALAYDIKECIGLIQLLLELGFDVVTIIVHEDNQWLDMLQKEKVSRSARVTLICATTGCVSKYSAGSFRYAIVQRRT